MKKFLIIAALALATAAGAQNQYTFVFLNNKPDAEKISDEQKKKVFEGHMANINRLAKEGKLVAAGPFDGGGGLFVLNTKNVEEASEWLSTDPGVQAKRWNVELLPYLPKRGGICPVGEKYEMTSYTFIRFIPVVSKSTTSGYAEMLKRHEAFTRERIPEENVITEAVFGENDGGILILRDTVQKAIFEKDPGVMEGFLKVDIKNLYIAKGSFCEK